MGGDSHEPADCGFFNCAAASCDDVTPLCESVSYDAWTLRCNFGWNLLLHGSIKNGHVVKEADFWEIPYNKWLFPLFRYLSFLGLKYACSTSTYGGRVRSCQLCNEDEQVRLHQKPMEISPFYEPIYCSNKTSGSPEYESNVVISNIIFWFNMTWCLVGVFFVLNFNTAKSLVFGKFRLR